MKIPKCSECPATEIGCQRSNGNLHNGSACENFHRAMAKKFTSTNKSSMFALQMPPSCAGCVVVCTSNVDRGSDECCASLWRHFILD